MRLPQVTEKAQRTVTFCESEAQSSVTISQYRSSKSTTTIKTSSHSVNQLPLATETTILYLSCYTVLLESRNSWNWKQNDLPYPPQMLHLSCLLLSVLSVLWFGPKSNPSFRCKVDDGVQCPPIDAASWFIFYILDHLTMSQDIFCMAPSIQNLVQRCSHDLSNHTTC